MISSREEMLGLSSLIGGVVVSMSEGGGGGSTSEGGGAICLSGFELEELDVELSRKVLLRAATFSSKLMFFFDFCFVFSRTLMADSPISILSSGSSFMGSIAGVPLTSVPRLLP